MAMLQQWQKPLRPMLGPEQSEYPRATIPIGWDKS